MGSTKKKLLDELNLFETLDPPSRMAYFNQRYMSKSGKYKRYVESPLRYAGGKSLAVGMILDLIPANTKGLISPFLGGGSVEIACANELGIKVIAYDIFDLLINYWHEQLLNPLMVYEYLKEFQPTNDEFRNVKGILKAHWTGDKIIDDKGYLAALYYFNSNTSYGPHFLGWPSSVYLQEKRYQKMIEKVRDFKAPNLEVHCAKFEDFLDQYSSEFLYCDPPYYLDGDSKTFVGMYPHRNFPIHHKNFPHDLLRDILHKHKGGFILSYNDCSTIREWYKDYKILSPEWQYTFSQGDTRIGENRLKNNNGSYVKKSHELIICGGRVN